ncbi:MAG: alcohol dehydrogenase catalytic domain-containing protein [Phycisphaerales bacterium]|jgi:L-iditol 2-dehydrogenase
MKAVIWKGGKTFEPGKFPEPTPGPKQILLKVEATSICTTDLHYDDFQCIPPIVPGHEVAGTVFRLGNEVTDIEIGQRVVVDPVQCCGDCALCKAGFRHLCLNVRHLGNEKNPGGWAEYVAIDADNVYTIPEGISFSEAALTEPVAVCLESFKRADFKPGQTVLVLGDGVFGCIHAMLAKIYKAGKIIVSGHYDERLKRISEKTGAVTCNTHKQRLEQVLDKEISQPGVDLVIEATGAAAAPNIGLEALRPRGALVLFSYVWHPEVLNLGLLNFKELNVLGACRSLDCFEQALGLIADGLLDAKALIDIEASLEDVNKAVTELRENKRNTFKAVLIPRH